MPNIGRVVGYPYILVFFLSKSVRYSVCLLTCIFSDDSYQRLGFALLIAYH